jgi:hypothetical protein
VPAALALPAGTVPVPPECLHENLPSPPVDSVAERLLGILGSFFHFFIADIFADRVQAPVGKFSGAPLGRSCAAVHEKNQSK